MAKQPLYPHRSSGKTLPSVIATEVVPENIYCYVPTVAYSGGIAFFLAPDRPTADVLAGRIRASAGLHFRGTLKELIAEIGRQGELDFVTME